MTYISLARKYRPQTFDEIVGQEHIATTLKNAISMNMVTHAYLFTGPRGVGKTSTARILAKSLNCEKAPTHNPCQKCTACNEISQGISMDVIEIDGASNRGIDEIRNLKENIKFASVHGKYRIYIIDEVHMLTQEAFNALLKTLEEPPPHVKFIFATTKPYKVLPTILSRCQRFDFRRISTHDITAKLEEIKKTEKLDVANQAIFLIAKAADGSLRDAEVILDQLLSFAKGKIKPEDVVKVLGLLEEDLLFDIANCIVNNEKDKILNIVNDLINSGKDPVFITSNIIEHFRNLMVAKVGKDGMGDHRLEEQAKEFSLDDILYITYTLSQTIDFIKKTTLSRIPLEVALIKLTEKKRLVSIKEILEKLALLEKKLPSYASQVEDESSIAMESEVPVGREREPTKTPQPAIPKEEVSQEKDILLLQKIKSSWGKILNFIKNKRMSIATFLSDSKLIRVKDNVFTIGFSKNNSLHKEALETNTNKKFIEEAIKSVVGEYITLNIESIEEPIDKELEGADTEKSEIMEETVGEGINKVDPIVESALDIFEGRIVDIRDKKKEAK